MIYTSLESHYATSY